MRNLAVLVAPSLALLWLSGCCCCNCCCGNGGGGGGSYDYGDQGGGLFDDMIDDALDDLAEDIQREIEEEATEFMLETVFEGQVKGDFEFDSDAGTLSYVDVDGSRYDIDVEGADWLGNFPVVDQYPGSTVDASMGADQKTEQTKFAAMLLSTPDGVDQVAAHYEPQMKGLANFNKQDHVDNGKKTTVLLGGLDNDRILVVSASETGASTTITMIVIEQDKLGDELEAFVRENP